MTIPLLDFQFIDYYTSLKYQDFETRFKNKCKIVVFQPYAGIASEGWRVTLHGEPCRVWWVFKSAQGHSDSLLMLFPNHEPLWKSEGSIENARCGGERRKENGYCAPRSK